MIKFKHLYQLEIRAKIQINSQIVKHSLTPGLQTSGKINLKKDDVVRYRASPADQWTSGVVLGRAGKATGKNKNEFNIVMEQEDDPVSVRLDNVTLEKQAIYHLVTDPGVNLSEAVR